MTDEWQPGIGSAQIKADSNAQEARKMSERIGPFTADYAISPGETLKEWREANSNPGTVMSTAVAAKACYAMPVEFYERKAA